MRKRLNGNGRQRSCELAMRRELIVTLFLTRIVSPLWNAKSCAR
jgi:hypothetical protein